MVCIDRIVSAPTDQAEGDDVLVGVQVMRDGLVELRCVSMLYYIRCMLETLLRWVAY